MKESNKRILDAFYIVVGVIAVILNVILLIISRRIASPKTDIRMSMVLAVFDLVIPASALIVLIQNMILDININAISHGCQIKGPLDFLGISFSMMLVSMIAVERVHLTLTIKASKFIWAAYATFTATYLVVVIAAAVKNEFYMLSNGIDCTPLPSASILSAVVSGLFALSLLTFLLITFGCYLLILRKLLRRTINNTEFENTISVKIQSCGGLPARASISPRSPKILVSVAFRIAVITITYFVIVFPSCVKILVDALIDHSDTELVDSVQIVGDVFLSLIALANPCLVLFAHSKMYQKLKDALPRIGCIFKGRF